jgi:hypothetical protein
MKKNNFKMKLNKADVQDQRAYGLGQGHALTCSVTATVMP